MLRNKDKPVLLPRPWNAAIGTKSTESPMLQKYQFSLVFSLFCEEHKIWKFLFC